MHDVDAFLQVIERSSEFSAFLAESLNVDDVKRKKTKREKGKPASLPPPPPTSILKRPPPAIPQYSDPDEGEEEPPPVPPRPQSSYPGYNEHLTSSGLLSVPQAASTDHLSVSQPSSMSREASLIWHRNQQASASSPSFDLWFHGAIARSVRVKTWFIP